MRDRFVFPWLPVAGLLFLAWLLVGCSTIKIKACLPGAAECTVAKFRGESTLEDPFIEYEREFEDGSVVRFRFRAAKSERDGNTIDQVIADAIVDRLLNQTGVITNE